MTRLVQLKNNSVSRLAANITNVATTITLTTGEGSKFPTLTGSQYFMGTLVKSDGTTEIVKVTARSGDTLTVTRAAEDVGGVQTAYAFTAGDRFEHRLTAGVLSNEIDRIDNGSTFEVLNKSANYTLTEADVTSFTRVNTVSGTVTITLPSIAALTDDYDVMIAKVSSDANVVTIARSSSDTINGGTSYTINNQWQSAWLIADRSTNTWTVITSGMTAVNTVVNTGTGTGSSATITLTGDPVSKNNVALYIGGVYQQKSTYTLSGTTITAGGNIPNGVAWEAVWSAPLSIGTPADAAVTPAKMSQGAPTWDTSGNNSVSGNFGFGGSPSAWNPAYRAIQSGAGSVPYMAGSTASSGSNAYFGVNAYIDAGGNYKYVNSQPANQILMSGGVIKLQTAPSGTAGNNITWTDTLIADANGNVGVGATPSAWGAGQTALQFAAGYVGTAGTTTNFRIGQNEGPAAIYKNNGAATRYEQAGGVHYWYTAPSGTAGNAISFTQAMTLDTSGNLTPAGNITAGKIVTGTEVATTSGTSIDFTGIPSWVKRIAITFRGVSTNGTSIPLIQIGSGSIQTTGYNSAGSIIVSPSVASSNATSGFLTSGGSSDVAATVRHGLAVLVLTGGNNWVFQCTLGSSDTTATRIGGGSVTLSGTLDRLRLTTVNGTDTFDAGSVNILYE